MTVAGAYDPQRRWDEAPAALRRAVAGSAAVDVTAPGELRLACDAGGISEHRGVTCLLAGSIYNRAQVAARLGLESDSETAEVLATGWLAWDTELPVHLRGGYVIALWQPSRRRGLLAVDHSALGSCFMHSADGVLRFATTMRGLLALLSRTPAPDRQALLVVLAGEGIPGDRTLLDGVTRLPAAHRLLFADSGWSRSPYWSVSYRGTLRGGREELAGELREQVARSIRLRLDDSRPTGIILSGGFDSTAVAGIATRELGDRPLLRGYSAVFPGEECDETDRIDLVVDACKMQSTQLNVAPQGLLGLTLQYLEQFGMPVCGPGYLFERRLLERAARDGVRVLLDGLGGDEVFGFSPYVLADRLLHGRLLAAMRLVRGWPGLEGRPSRAQLRWLLRNMIVEPAVPYRLHARLRRRGDPERHSPDWITGADAAALAELHDPLAWKRDRKGPLWWSLMASLLTTVQEGAGGIAEYAGLRGSGLSVESRPPLYDVDLTEFILTLPPELAMGDPNRALARESVRGLVPDAVRLFSGKSNLAPFYAAALQAELAPVKELMRDARIYEYVDAAFVRRQLERPPAAGEAGWAQWTILQWALMTHECWLRNLEDPGFARRFRERYDLDAPHVREIS